MIQKPGVSDTPACCGPKRSKMCYNKNLLGAQMTQSKFWNGKSEFWNNKPEFWNSRREFWNGKSEFWNNKPEFWNRKKVVQKPGVSDTPGCCGPKRLKK